MKKFIEKYGKINQGNNYKGKEYNGRYIYEGLYLIHKEGSCTAGCSYDMKTKKLMLLLPIMMTIFLLPSYGAEGDSTVAQPYVERISTGSVPDDYDEDIPIYIYGDYFDTDSVDVYFNDTSAHLGETRVNYIEVYLPDGSRRLDPGVYDITVENDRDNRRKIIDAFTVVKSGEALIEDNYILKKEGRQGEVQGDLKISHDTLVLSSRYTNRPQLHLDLDQWMGEEVLGRTLQFRGDIRDKIGMLRTNSKWADITLYGVTLAEEARDNEVQMNLGRTEPLVVKALKDKLGNKAIKSEFIQITGENYKFTDAFLSIPIQRASSKDLKVYRYDEETRTFYQEPATVDLVDQRVELFSANKGIFVVVE